MRVRVSVRVCVWFQGLCKFACACMCNACLPLCVCIDEKTVLMGSGTTITLSPWCFLTLMHTCPYPHPPPTSHPSQPPPPHHHQSDKWHAEPSVDTGAQCDSRAHPIPLTLPSSITPGTSSPSFSSLQMQPLSRLQGEMHERRVWSGKGSSESGGMLLSVNLYYS